MRAYVTHMGASNPGYGAGGNEAGFTLLEIMVAMVVLTMIITAALGALRLGERSWETGLARAGETEALRTVSGLLQRQFNQILPLTWAGQTQTYIAFGGSHDQVRFIAPAPQHHGATGLFEFTLIVEPHASGYRLVLYYRLHDPNRAGFMPDNSDSQRVMLLDKLKKASFSYYGSPVSGNPPRWYSHWDSDAEAFPQLVHAHLVANSERQQWPELYFLLHSSLPPSL